MRYFRRRLSPSGPIKSSAEAGRLPKKIRGTPFECAGRLLMIIELIFYAESSAANSRFPILECNKESSPREEITFPSTKRCRILSLAGQLGRFEPTHLQNRNYAGRQRARCQMAGPTGGEETLDLHRGRRLVAWLFAGTLDCLGLSQFLAGTVGGFQFTGGAGVRLHVCGLRGRRGPGPVGLDQWFMRRSTVTAARLNFYIVREHV
jgi:hypothetical protein